MDLYFRKTRKPTNLINAPIKRKLSPDPVLEKAPTKVKSSSRKRLFKEDDVHLHDEEDKIIGGDREEKTDNLNKNERLIDKIETIKPLDIESQSKTTATDNDNKKIESGPLRGVSSSLLELIRAKEAEAKKVTPEEQRRRELLGIVPEIVRIVPTVFTANKREVMLYDRVVEKCHKSLKSNYTSSTIIECLDLMDKVAPEWVSVVQISKGKFMRFNKTKYTIAQLLEAIRRYKNDC